MQMIDVLKRLAELDAVNPNVDTGLRIVQPQKNISVAVTESTQVDECGMMPGAVMDRPSTPASINMTAASGEELSDMIRAIATLAGTAKGGEEVVTGTPTAGDSMRSVLDKLNPMDDEETEEGFIGRGLGGEIGGSIGDVAGTALGSMVGGPVGGLIGGTLGDIAGTSIGAEMGDDEEQKETYDNTPNDPTDTNEFDAEQHAHHENPPGADRKGNANNPRAYDTNESIAQRLMAEYQSFISEN